MNVSLHQVGEKYRLKISETGGFLRQMGPRKLSKDRAEYRAALLNGEEPYNYSDDPTTPAASDAAQAAVDTYVAGQQAKIDTAQAAIEADNAAIEEQNAIIEQQQSVVSEQDEIIAAQQAIIDNPESTEEQIAAAQTAKAEAESTKATAEAAIAAAETEIGKKQSDITKQEKNIATAEANIADADNKASAPVITEVPEVLTLDNTPKKGWKVEADFSANEVTTIEANEEVEGGITLKNTGAEPANLIIDVGNSDVTLYTNCEWNEVTVKSVGNDTLTVATNTHIKKLILERGHVKVNNAYVEDCIDEVVVKGGKIEANKEVEVTKASQLSTSTPAIYKINTDVSVRNFALGILASGHFVFENNAVASTTGTSTSSGFLIRGSKMVVEFKGEGEWRSANNPTIWNSNFDAVVKIFNGKYFNDANHSECIYAEKGFIEIYGGEFHNVDNGDKNFLLNCLDANYKSGKANITVYGGKFYGFDPAHNGAESSDDSTNFVAEGYESIYREEGGYYEVVPVD